MTCATCHKTRSAVFSALAGGDRSLEMTADYTFRIGRVHIQYLSGETYRKVPSAVVTAVLDAGSGFIVDA